MKNFQLIACLFAAFAFASLTTGCSDDDHDDHDHGGAGAEGGAGGAGAEGGAGGGNVPASPDCPAEGDKCPAACTYLAACAVNSGICVGYEAGNEETQTGIYESCLETCAGLPVQATLVCGHTECSQTVALANG
ncbi:MAG: hypothetical protein CMH52_08425, partial [Myxococcales bacterium]|nr:hypothetical protein [Myxococcales bacterium]